MGSLTDVINSYEMVYMLGDSAIRYHAPSEEAIEKFHSMSEEDRKEGDKIAKTKDEKKRLALILSQNRRRQDLAVFAIKSCVVDCTEAEAIKLASMAMDKEIQRFIQICCSMVGVTRIQDDNQLGN